MEIENLAGVWPNVAINPATGKTYESEYSDNGVSVPICPDGSREELEADLWALTMKWKSYKGNFMKIYSSVAYAQIKELLDRQAAITKEYWASVYNKDYDQYETQIAELTAERDNLQNEIEYLRKVCQTQADSFAAIENENTVLRSKLNRIRELAERLQDA